jgi:hypothetical protein
MRTKVTFSVSREQLADLYPAAGGSFPWRVHLTRLLRPLGKLVPPNKDGSRNQLARVFRFRACLIQMNAMGIL